MRIDEIKNQEQYDRQTANLATFETALENHIASQCPPDIHPLLWKAQQEALESVRDEIEDRMREWEKKLK